MAVGEAAEERRDGAGGIEVWTWRRELVDHQPIHERQEVVDVIRGIRRAELAEQWLHPDTDLVLEVSDHGPQGGLVGRFHEDGSPRLAQHTSGAGELLEELADGTRDGLDAEAADVDGQPVQTAVSRSRMRRSTAMRSESRVRNRFDVDPIGRPAAASTARWVSWRMPRVPNTSIAASSRRSSRVITSSDYISSDPNYICSTMSSMTAVPFGSLFFAWCTLMAVAPLRRPRRMAVISWISSMAVIELPFVFLYIVVGSAVPVVLAGGLDGSGPWISLALAGLTSAGLIVVARRALRSGPVVEQALVDGLGADWRRELDPDLASRLRRHLPWGRILFLPWMFGRHDVERLANVAYGDDGTSNLLDVYRHRSHPTNAPTLVYLHGGGFHWGRKSRESRPLLYHFASQGWTCISANYHLAPPRRRLPPQPHRREEAHRMGSRAWT